jgi:hypothetical protein
VELLIEQPVPTTYVNVPSSELGEVEFEVLAHRGSIEEVRLVERADLAAHELRVDRELVE